MGLRPIPRLARLRGPQSPAPLAARPRTCAAFVRSEAAGSTLDGAPPHTPPSREALWCAAVALAEAGRLARLRGPQSPAPLAARPRSCAAFVRCEDADIIRSRRRRD